MKAVRSLLMARQTLAPEPSDIVPKLVLNMQEGGTG